MKYKKGLIKSWEINLKIKSKKIIILIVDFIITQKQLFKKYISFFLI